MRDKFIEVLYEIAKKDRDVNLITGDLGFGVFDKFWTDFPKQFINAGICEQNMTGVAAGMGMDGKTVFTYSIGNFPTLRALEQIRNDVAYHRSNVKIVCVGGGFAYGALGMSHHATEDIAIVRALPEMIVFSPCDPIEVEEITKVAYEIKGPCYIRLGRGGENNLHKGKINFQLGKAIKLVSGSDIVIFSTGGITEEAIKASQKLKSDDDINVGVYSFHTIKPIDVDLIKKIAMKNKTIITLEEHNNIGGLGGAVAEVMTTFKNSSKLIRLGLNDTYTSVVGSQNYLRNYYNLNCDNIIKVVQKELSIKK
jgi:transketolase